MTANGQRSVQADTVSNKHRYDCFYLYPTASNENTTNSDLTVQPTETSIAVAESGDPRPVVNEIAGPTRGYHFQDINLALGDLVHDVHTAEAAYNS